MVSTTAPDPAHVLSVEAFVREPGPRPLGHDPAGLLGCRGFPSREQGGPAAPLPSFCLRHRPPSNPCPSAQLHALRPSSGLWGWEAAVSPAGACRAGARSALNPCPRPPRLLPLSVPSAPFSPQILLILPQSPPPTLGSRLDTWNEQVLLKGRLMWAPSRESALLPPPVLGRLGLHHPQPWATAHIPLLGKKECLCPGGA